MRSSPDYTTAVANPDKSNGYEDVAQAFIAGRGSDSAETGASDVAEWSRTLPPEATVLDLGCGTGVPISQALIERGFHVYGVDASHTMLAAFRARFPDVRIECAAVEESHFFGRTFDGVVAWGLSFYWARRSSADYLRRWLPCCLAVADFCSSRHLNPVHGPI